MYDIVMLSAVLSMADRFKETLSYEKFLDTFREEQHDDIESILVDFGYIEFYWPEVKYMTWTGKQSYRWK